MELIKSIDTGATYKTLDNFWWIHNDTLPSKWVKSNLEMSKAQWTTFFTQHFTPFAQDYRRKDKDRPFEISSISAFHNLYGQSLIVQVDINSEVDDKITLSIDTLFELRLSTTVQSLIEELNRFVSNEDDKTQVFMVVQETGGLALRSFDINIPQLDIELNYGTEWKEKHEYLLSVLDRKTKKGIALLHGLPGTGKSMYIRHLISLLSETRTIIYIPNQLIPSLTDPSFLPLISNYSNAILIIEDAEEAIKSRKTGGRMVDNLLNLSDGIISDFLGTQIICTFNSDISLIDEALLRKGRLILKHEFKRLSKEQAQLLSDKLGFATKIDCDMTLTEVYNQEDKFTDEGKKYSPIGFGL